MVADDRAVIEPAYSLGDILLVNIARFYNEGSPRRGTIKGSYSGWLKNKGGS
jgi:hypothetical protein